MLIDRTQEIKNKLVTEGRVFVNQLSGFFNVSEVTIRKDLKFLEDQGIATRFYGGAQLKKESPLVFVNKEYYNNQTLISIANLALKEIKDGDSIFLGSGQTCCVLAKMLGKIENLTVITNNISALNDLIENVSKVYLIGGEVTTIDGVTMFSSTQNPLKNLENIFVKKAFTSSFGVDIKAGLTANALISTYIYKSIIDISTNIYLLADSSKFGKIGIYPVANITDINCFISNEIPLDYKQIFIQNKINFIED